MVLTLSYMFYYAIQFNSDLSKWNVSNVSDFSYMFYNASNFNSNLKNWNLKNCMYVEYMFFEATSFDTATVRHWDLSCIESKKYLFGHSIRYNCILM